MGDKLQLLVAMGGYMLIVIGIGVFFAKKSQANSDNYFLGGRSLGPWVAAMSAEASDMSGWLLMGLPGVAYWCGIADAAWTAIGLAIGTYVNWLLVSRRLRSYSIVSGNAITIPDFLSNRFHEKKKTILVVAAFFILIFFTVYAASCFVTCGKLFSGLFGYSYHSMMIVGAAFVLLYTILGGFLAESASDFMQAVVMICALVGVLVCGVIHAGGLGAVIENARAIPGYLSLTQIATPVFRMLGPDPIYGYDEKAELYPQAHPSCNTLEPVWFTGRDPDAIDWLLDCYYGQECMNFAYATAGQENSFGWTDVQAGLETQFEKIRKLVNDGKLTVETLGDTGRWFRRTFDRTPATALTALSDREQNDIRSVWYDCQNYRASVQLQGDRLYFRDIYRFDDAYRERYLTEACKEWQATYDNLPVIDGRLWSTPETTARLELDVPVQSIDVQRTGENTLAVTALTADGESIHIDFAESGFAIRSAQPHCWLFRRGQDHGTTLTAEPHALHLTHNGFEYTVPVVGTLTPRDGGYDLATEHEEIAFRLAGPAE